MKKELRWYDHFAINAYWLGQSFVSGVMTPILTPWLVLFFAPESQKNTYLSIVNIIGLAVAMLVQPLAGYLSDHSTSRWGRRRPYIFLGALLNSIFVILMATSPAFGSMKAGSPNVLFGVTLGFIVLIVATIFSQFVSNIAQGALNGLIPDLVPERQRGFSSGTKSVFELLPSLLILAFGIGALVDKGQGLLVGIIMAVCLLVTMVITVIAAKEKPGEGTGKTNFWETFWRILALTVLFVGITQLVTLLLNQGGRFVANMNLSSQVLIIGLLGLAGMAGAIFLGVYYGASVGIGKGAKSQSSFIWWVVNRLLFLAAIGAIQGFAYYFLQDVIRVEKVGFMTTLLMGAVALFLLPSALIGGKLADKVGKKRLVSISGVIATVGSFLLVGTGFLANTGFLNLSQGVLIGLVMFSGCIIGTGTGTFMATNWALGTDLVPPEQAGKFLGISNLAGAGAGIVGRGIGGPLADFFNGLLPGLGYLVIFTIYAVLFLLSVVVLVKVKVKE
jgi:MFS family permease